MISLNIVDVLFGCITRELLMQEINQVILTMNNFRLIIII